MKNKLNIALVFHGLSGGLNYKNGRQIVNGVECYRNIKENVIESISNSGSKIDIFFHTWESDQQDLITELYKPVDFIIESPKILSSEKITEKFKTIIINKYLGRDESLRKNNIFSRWYSFSKSLSLVEKYNAKYDFVISMRFDMIFKRPIKLIDFDLEKINLGKWTAYTKNGKDIIPDEQINRISLDILKEVKRGYPKRGEGLHDFYIACNSNIMLPYLANIYDNLDSLINKVGLSNHNILLEKIKKENLEDKINYNLSYIHDYTLFRWQ